MSDRRHAWRNGRGRRWRAAPALLGVVALGLSLGAWAPSSRSQQQFDPKTRGELAAIVRRAMAIQRVPGVVVGVWVPGRGTWVRAFGKANIVTGAPMRVDDHVRIASITKSFVATAVLQLVDQGRLRLSDRLSKFVAGVPNGNRITIRNLLAMTSGIYSFTNDDTFNRDFERNPTFSFGLRQILAIVRRHGPDFAPGARCVYSDTNYLLLGAIIEKVTGKGSDRIIQKQILDPLGLKHTSLPRTPAVPWPFAHGYYAGEEGTRPLRDYTRVNPMVPWTGGGMISTLADLHTWGKALATGALLSNRTRAQAFRFRDFYGGKNSGYGLGMNKVYGFIGHHGAIFGFNSVVYYLPKARATIVVEENKSTNASQESVELFVAIAMHLFPKQFAVG